MKRLVGRIDFFNEIRIMPALSVAVREVNGLPHRTVELIVVGRLAF